LHRRQTGQLVFRGVFPRSPSFSRSLQSQSWVTALILGSLLGVIAYGTYDMTNLATLRGWPVALSAVDLVQGSALTGVSATVGYLAARWVGAGV
jgi:uncharacterized membrane protein